MSVARRRLDDARERVKRDESRGEFIQLDDPPARVALRRSSAARRLSLSVSAIDGRARLTLPSGCARGAAERFLEQHRDWLRRVLEKAPETVPLELGARVPFRGVTLEVRRVEGLRGARIDLESRAMLVGGKLASAGAQVEAALREAAREQLLARSRVHAQALDVSFSRIVIRDPRSRWGSCSSRGTLSYSWRLIMAPDAVLDYVAAHEVAHRREMNHSARFWALVEQVRPDWRTQRDWLRRHGVDLHRFQLAAG